MRATTMPNNTKWSQGPWALDGAHDREHSYYEIYAPTPEGLNDAYNYVVADTLNRHHCIDPDEDRANAQLISAAPQLYDACEYAMSMLEDIRWEGFTAAKDAVRKKLDEAIEKARGRG